MILFTKHDSSITSQDAYEVTENHRTAASIDATNLINLHLSEITLLSDIECEIVHYSAGFTVAKLLSK